MVGIMMIFGQDGDFSSAAVMRMARSKVGNSKKRPQALGKAGPIWIRPNGMSRFRRPDGAGEREREMHYTLNNILYIGYLGGGGGGGKIFVVFVVERRNTKFLPTKQYRKVPGCGLVYCDHENFPTNWPKIHCSRKFCPPEEYPLYGK